MINFNIVVFASGGGGNFQALINKQKDFGYKIILLIVDRVCEAINKAKKNNIKYILVEKHMLKNSFIPKNANLIVLAGFKSIISNELCEIWKNKIINTHPSLLPKFGGKGMIGVKVQEAVMKAGEKKAGCTVHYVTKNIDGGEIILQKTVSVNYKETPMQLGYRIHKLENILLPKAVKILKNKLQKQS